MAVQYVGIDTAMVCVKKFVRTVLLVAVCVGGVWPHAARADARVDARRHFKSGMALIERGRHLDGISELLRAYELMPHPVVLYNIARAYADRGDDAEAIAQFERYLQTEPADAAEVAAYLVTLRQRLRTRRDNLVANEQSGHTSPALSSQASAEAGHESEVSYRVTLEALETLRETVAHFEALAQVTESEAMREKASRLRRLVAELKHRQNADGDGTHRQASYPLPRYDGGGGLEVAVVAPQGIRIEHAEIYEETVITASRFEQSPLDAPNTTTIVTAQDIRLTGLTSVADLLRRVAGVELMTLTPGDTQVSIRGFNQRLSNKTLVLINGRSVYLDFLGATFWSALPIASEDIERIEVIKGPASALYGANAFSGVINIILREPGYGKSVITGGGGNGSVGRSVVLLSGRSGRLQYRIGGGYERADQYALVSDPARVDVEFAADDPDLGLRRQWFNTEMRYALGHGYVGRWGTAVSTGDLSFLGIGRLRQLQASDVVMAQTHLSLEMPFGLTARAFWNAFSADVYEVQSPPGALRVDTDEVASHIADFELRLAREMTFGLRHSFAAGANYRYKTVRWGWFSDDAVERSQHHWSAYVQDTVHMAQSVQLEVSARADKPPLHPAVELSPRGSLVVRPTYGSAVRATVGTAFRIPSFAESYIDLANPTPVRGVTGLGKGSLELANEQILSVELGYLNQESDYFALDMTAYYNEVDNPIVFAELDAYRLNSYPGFNSEAAAYPVGQVRFKNDETSLRQIGAEVGMRIFPTTGVDFYANYSYHATSPLHSSSASVVSKLDQRTSAHKVNAGVQLRTPFGVDLAVDVHYVSPQVWVEQVVSARSGAGFAAHALDAYTLVNGRVGYRTFDEALEFGCLVTGLVGDGQRQHPFGQPIRRRVFGSVVARF